MKNRFQPEKHSIMRFQKQLMQPSRKAKKNSRDTRMSWLKREEEANGIGIPDFINSREMMRQTILKRQAEEVARRLTGEDEIDHYFDPSQIKNDMDFTELNFDLNNPPF